MSENGILRPDATIPDVIRIGWNPQTNDCEAHVNLDALKTVGMAKAVLRMTIEKLEYQERIIQSAQIRQMAAEEMANAQLAQRVARGR